jgi:hypothetical protein
VVANAGGGLAEPGRIVRRPPPGRNPPLPAPWFQLFRKEAFWFGVRSGSPRGGPPGSHIRVRQAPHLGQRRDARAADSGRFCRTTAGRLARPDPGTHQTPPEDFPRQIGLSWPNPPLFSPNSLKKFSLSLDRENNGTGPQEERKITAAMATADKASPAPRD